MNKNNGDNETQFRPFKKTRQITKVWAESALEKFAAASGLIGDSIWRVFNAVIRCCHGFGRPGGRVAPRNDLGRPIVRIIIGWTLQILRVVGVGGIARRVHVLSQSSLGSEYAHLPILDPAKDAAKAWVGRPWFCSSIAATGGYTDPTVSVGTFTGLCCSWTFGSPCNTRLVPTFRRVCGWHC